MNHPADTADPTPVRAPRRVARLLALDERIESLVAARLDRINRRAPLPAGTIAAVNRLLTEAAPVLARAPRALRTPPFDPAGPVMPGDAFVALMKLRVALRPPPRLR